jgi:hypothetical protein
MREMPSGIVPIDFSKNSRLQSISGDHSLREVMRDRTSRSCVKVERRNDESFEEGVEKPNSVQSCMRPTMFSDVIPIAFSSSASVKSQKALRETGDVRRAGLDSKRGSWRKAELFERRSV